MNKRTSRRQAYHCRQTIVETLDPCMICGTIPAKGFPPCIDEKIFTQRNSSSGFGFVVKNGEAELLETFSSAKDQAIG